MPEEARGECWWLVLRDGTLVPGDQGGGVAVLSEVRLARPLGRALAVLHAAPLVNALDKLVARHRGRLGKLVPDREPVRRYP